MSKIQYFLQDWKNINQPSVSGKSVQSIRKNKRSWKINKCDKKYFTIMKIQDGSFKKNFSFASNFLNYFEGHNDIADINYLNIVELYINV